jgi:hypothetical protein
VEYSLVEYSAFWATTISESQFRSARSGAAGPDEFECGYWSIGRNRIMHGED